MAVVLTGTLVSADKKVAVFAGNTHVSVQGGDSGNIVEQMLPLHSYGTEFAVMPSPVRYGQIFILLILQFPRSIACFYSEYGDQLKVMTRMPNTSFTLYTGHGASETYMLPNAGDPKMNQVR